ncbi:hypothetical protein [Nocardia sp. BMG111209]|uniref:hypothetical protein n=1 Tax=Nocardia sp. BMG111209 TaxID=1160137 RepID=UPI00036290C7|nr:hypothetical protein [Nocardia sp. BMG111209]
MPGWRDFLDRFRPAGAPGSAVPGGIPVDRAAAAAAELMPLLARLDDDQQRADQIRRAALDRADRIRRDGSATAATVRAQATENAESVAAQTEQMVIGSAAPTAGDGAPDTAEIARQAAQRLPDEVERVVAAARELIAQLCAPIPDSADR